MSGRCNTEDRSVWLPLWLLAWPSLSQREPEPRLFPPQRPMNCANSKGLCGRREVREKGEGRRGPLTSSEQPETKAQKVQAEGNWMEGG